VVASVRSRIAAHLDSHLSEKVTAITKTGQVDDQTLALLVSAVRDLAQDVAAASHEAAAP
jgi:F-type H+-transporting ATPase subunit alpha